MKRKVAVSAASAGDAVKAAAKHRCAFNYDDVDKTIFTTHPNPVYLGTSEEIASYFDDCIRFWRERCGGERVYIVVDYENLTSNLKEIDAYAAQVKRVLNECAIAIVRYSGSMLQRTASRMTAIQLHIPSNAYASREEAVSVVRGLRQGTIRTAAAAGR
jgi:hypothetical protein